LMSAHDGPVGDTGAVRGAGAVAGLRFSSSKSLYAVESSVGRPSGRLEAAAVGGSRGVGRGAGAVGVNVATAAIARQP
jgi:hypothetical protein